MSSKFISTTLPVILVGFVIISLGLYLAKFNSTSTSVSSTSPTPSTTEPFPTLVENRTVENLIAEARSELVDRLNIVEQDISTKEVESVTWSDSSLGCPEPGQFYTQVLTPGYKIVLEAKGKLYNYHSSLVFVKPCG